MPLSLHRGNSNNGFLEPLPKGLDIGLINNMPDRALAATERQFATLLDAASDDIDVRLSFYALPGVPREGPARDYVSGSYFSIERLWDTRPDALIVTGTEPKAPNLPDEPYWAAFKQVLAWAQHNTLSTIWSCLAAHAAVLCCDRIRRRRLSAKHFGVFECARESDHLLLSGLPRRLLMPHSRWNDVPLDQLKECGYQVLTRDMDGMADCFIKQRKSLFVFFQGHPEYEANTLFLEYRRDVARFLNGERETYPPLPRRYFDPHTAYSLQATREQFTKHRCPEEFAAFPGIGNGKNLANVWRSGAVHIYRNWLLRLCALKQQLLAALPSTIPVGAETRSSSGRSFAAGE